MLAKIAVFTGIKLGARVIKIFIFDKGTKVGSKEVVGPGNNIPCQVSVTAPATSVDWDSTGYGIYDLDPRGFRIVNADPGARIRLKPAIFGCNSQNEVSHKRTRIDPGGDVALRHNVIKWIPQGEVSAASETVVEEIAFDGRSDYSRPKDVTEFDAAKKSDIIFRINVQTV